MIAYQSVGFTGISEILAVFKGDIYFLTNYIDYILE